MPLNNNVGHCMTHSKISWAEGDTRGDRGHGRLYDKISWADGGKGSRQTYRMARAHGLMGIGVMVGHIAISSGLGS